MIMQTISENVIIISVKFNEEIEWFPTQVPVFWFLPNVSQKRIVQYSLIAYVINQTWHC